MVVGLTSASERIRTQQFGCLAENGSSRQVSVRNDPKEEILRQAVMLRSSVGRKAKIVLKHRHLQKTPSIQRPAQQLQQ